MKSYINLQYFILIVVVIIVSVVVSNNNYCKTVISSQRLQSLKRDLIDQFHLVASTSSASSAGSTDSQDLLMWKIQQLESHSPFAFDSEDQFRVLDGKWKTIFTTLPLKRLQTLKSLTYSSIPIDIPITVTALYQSVDYAAKTYDNHIDFSLDTMSETGGFLSTIGSILQVKDDSVSSILREGARNRPSRLLIDFSEMFLAPRVDLTQASSVEIR